MVITHEERKLADEEIKAGLIGLAIRLKQSASYQQRPAGLGDFKIPPGTLTKTQQLRLVESISDTYWCLADKQERSKIETYLCTKAHTEAIIKYANECCQAGDTHDKDPLLWMASGMAYAARPIKDTKKVIAAIPGITVASVNRELIDLYLREDWDLDDLIVGLIDLPGITSSQRLRIGTEVLLRCGPKNIIRVAHVVPEIDPTTAWSALTGHRFSRPAHFIEMAHLLRPKTCQKIPNHREVMTAMVGCWGRVAPIKWMKWLTEAIEDMRTSDPSLTIQEAAILLSTIVAGSDKISGFGARLLADWFVRNTESDLNAMQAVKDNLLNASPALTAQFFLMAPIASLEEYMRHRNNDAWGKASAYDVMSGIAYAIGKIPADDRCCVDSISRDVLRQVEKHMLHKAKTQNIVDWANALYRGEEVVQFYSRVYRQASAGTVADLAFSLALSDNGRQVIEPPEGMPPLTLNDLQSDLVVRDVLSYAKVSEPHDSASRSLEALNAFGLDRLSMEQITQLIMVIESTALPDTVCEALDLLSDRIKQVDRTIQTRETKQKDKDR